MPEKSSPKTVASYLKSVSADRKAAVSALRQVVLDNLPKGLEEGIQYGMIGYFVPHSIYPNGYHCDPKQPLPFAHIASQKSHIGLYLFCMYSNDELIEWFKGEYAKTGFKLDMGKACIRFKKPDQIPFDLIGRTIKKVPVKKFIAFYESNLNPSGSKKSVKSSTAKTSKKATTKKVAKPKKAAATKSSKKKTATKKAATKKTGTNKAVTKKATGTNRAAKAKTSKPTKTALANRSAKKKTTSKRIPTKSAKKKS